MSEHTPGPWTAGQVDNEFYVDSKNKTVADEIDNEADARLIAAAPDYDAAARTFIAPYAKLSDDFLREIATGFPYVPGRLHVVTSMSITAHSAQAILDFRAAIAKAAGASS